MLCTYESIFREVEAQRRRRTIAIAMAEDRSVLEACKSAQEKGLAHTLLVGDPEKIKPLAAEIGLELQPDTIIPAFTEEENALRAVQAVRAGHADILMKGHISTPVLMKAVLQRETGLRKGDILSHVAVAEVPTYPRLLLLTDGGINILPDLETKKAILRNALGVAVKLGIEQPHVAVLCPIEKVNPKIPETLDAAALQQLGEQGEFGNTIVEGPIATDVALSAQAAARKGLASRVAGKTDLVLVPNITCGNAFIKVLMFLANAKVGGVVVGAQVPIILLSRADNPEEKLYSIALALILSD
jgi:phosphate butyryltransferase